MQCPCAVCVCRLTCGFCATTGDSCYSTEGHMTHKTAPRAPVCESGTWGGGKDTTQRLTDRRREDRESWGGGAVSTQVEEQQARVSDELYLLQHQICHFLNDHYCFLTPALIRLKVLGAGFCCRYAASVALLTADFMLRWTKQYYDMKQHILCIYFV